MRAFLIGLFFFFSGPAFAAKYEVVPKEKLERHELVEMASFWEAGPGLYDDIYYQASTILKKRPSEPYKHSLMQMLWGSYTYEVSVEEVPLSADYLQKEITFLFDAATWLQSEASPSDIRKYKRELLRLFLKLAHIPNIQIYAGVIEGDFSSSFVHISVVDVDNQQTLSLIGGHTE